MSYHEAYIEGIRDGWRAAAKAVALMAIREVESPDGIPEVAEALDALSLALLDARDEVQP